MNVLTLPGLWGSGPEHWQSQWEAKHPEWKRVEQRDWEHPDRKEWVDTLSRYVAAEPAPPVLAAHSLACSLVAQWVADTGGHGVAGAFLVAPSDVEGPNYPEEGKLFATNMPLVRLPFPSLLVASADDPYVALERAEQFARAWGSELVNVGDAGHINTSAGYGPWPEGEAMLLQFCGRV
jgi:predicted alpha/beta hydrolase family esterase